MQFLAIVFTDVVESCKTKRDVSLGRDDRERDRAYLERIQAPHFNLIRRCCAAHGGREMSTIGDAFYLTFEDPVEAVRCAVSIQRQLAETPIMTPREPLRLRIGIHGGFPAAFEGGFHGADVDAAARVEAAAAERQILVSSRIHQLVNHMTDVKFHALGEFDLKGVGPISLWEADWDGYGPRPAQVAPLLRAKRDAGAARARFGSASRWKWIWAGSAAVVLAAGALLVQREYGIFHFAAPEQPLAPPSTNSLPSGGAIPAVSVTVADSWPFFITLDDDVPANGSDGQTLSFTVRDGFKAGDTVVVPKGAKVSGSLMAGKKILGLWGKRMNFRLMQADAVNDQKLNVRATPGPGGKGPATRSFDTAKGPRSKELAAAKGTEFIAYTDGQQTVSVRK
jgi:class 3 adenylate cyclase